MDSTALRNLATAATEGADTIDALTAQVAELRAQLAEHQRPPILWGSSAWQYGTETYAQALARTEAALGRLDVVRRFYKGAPAWPADTGDRQLHVSFKWAPRDVLAGKHDAAFKAWCAKAPDRVTYWTYFHEPEDNAAAGEFTAVDYRNAWRRLAAIAKASGRKLAATLCLMGWTLDPRSGRNWRDYYPGADVIDVLSWDSYHRVSGQSDAAKVYAACRQVSTAEGKPWAVAETGVASDLVPDPAERQRLLTALARDLSTVKPAPVFVAYFDSPVGNNSTGWPISRDPQAAAAWTAGRG